MHTLTLMQQHKRACSQSLSFSFSAVRQVRLISCSRSNSHQLTLMGSIFLATVFPRLQYPGGNAPHVRHLRHHSLKEKNPSTNERSVLSKTCCTPYFCGNLSCVPQAQYNLELFHSQESCVPHLELHSRQLSMFQTWCDQTLHPLLAY